MKETPRTQFIDDLFEGLDLIPLDRLLPDKPEVVQDRQGRYSYRAVACFLLSGRVPPKADGTPRLPDLDRLCKEANFHPRHAQRIATFLIALGAVDVDDRAHYTPGPNMDAFWDREVLRLQAAAREAVLKLQRMESGQSFWRLAVFCNHDLISFVTLFFVALGNRAIREDHLDLVMGRFAALAPEQVHKARDTLGLTFPDLTPSSWRELRKERGRKALLMALYIAEWAYGQEDEKNKRLWIFPSEIARAALGFSGPLAQPQLATVFTVQQDLSVFAGAGLPWRRLVPLFRHAKVRRIDQVFEFRLDRKMMANAPADHSATEELREVFQDVRPLPATVADVLSVPSKVGGRVGVRYCKALVRPSDEGVLEAIRRHPRLKNYLDATAPPGYLLIKDQSDPDNFVMRCRELGFEVHPLA